MKNVIISELYKIRRSKIFLGTAALLLGMLGIGIAATVYGEVRQPGSARCMTGIMAWQSAFSGDIVFYIVLVFTACQLTQEYAYGTVRQLACRGIARWQLAIGQYLALAAAVTLLLAGFGALNAIAGTAFGGFGAVTAMQLLPMLAALICMFFGVAGLGALIAALFKNSAVALGVCLLVVVGSNYLVALAAELSGKPSLAQCTLGGLRGIILELTTPAAQRLGCGLGFALLGLAAAALSVVIFTLRDVD